ncbi:hypothetical protein SDC9_163936 [bioreactor metagenome]|uniref:Uncharacterized protein n=1 Tax=bioreactor metagenome TaxID=1076179 RepID=A0A645FQA3_9ZZZZ
MKKHKEKKEFSKKIFIGVSMLTVSITLYACVLMWITKDTGGLAYLIPAVFAEFATATGFYYNKARAENEIKIQNSDRVRVVEKEEVKL